MNIVVFETGPGEADAFARLGPAHTIEKVSEPLGPDNVARFAEAQIVSPFIYSKLDATVLRQMPKLKLVATRSTGFDHIDTAYCRNAGIAVANVPTYGENTVAEHVFALLLAISHRLPEAVERARSGRFSPEGLRGIDLAGRTMGVIGTGNIGRHVIRIANGFSMDVLAYDVRPDRTLPALLSFRYVDLPELLAACDVISLHVPASPDTENLLSDAEFAQMKDGAILINTARGGLVDSRALIRALRSGKLGGAGLDVLPDEPLIREEAELIGSKRYRENDLTNLVADHVLLHLPNVVVTPHSAFNTSEAVRRIVETTVDNVAAFLKGTPRNIVA